MKTKPFLLATAGSTVDGRVIDDKMLDEMASSFDPKTYGARLNIEHIRGISGDKPFRAYGDVDSVSIGETEVNFNGTVEKRKALFGVFDVTEDAKALNAASQKVYPSIEIEPNFGGKGFAYLMGCALTDSPAAIGTERLTFNRQLPGTILLTAKDSGIEAATLELVEDAPATAAAAEEIKSFFSKFTELLTGAVPKPEAKPETPPANAGQFNAAEFTAKLGETLETAFTKQGQANDAKFTELTGKIEALAKSIDTTADPQQQQRPPALGGGEGYSRTDC